MSIDSRKVVMVGTKAIGHTLGLMLLIGLFIAVLEGIQWAVTAWTPLTESNTTWLTFGVLIGALVLVKARQIWDRE